MSFLRRSIFASLFLYFLLTAGLAYGLLWNLQNFTSLSPDAAGILTVTFALVLMFGLVYTDIHRPLKRVTHEMKALLTGKPYRRIFTVKTNELGVLAHFFNEVTRNLESISSNVQSHARIQKELDSAQDIQRLLIPKIAPNISGLKITAKTRPASEIGGDTFDFFTKNGRVIMYIGDSTGHGIPAALVMVMVDVLLETFIEIENSLQNILIRLNQYLKPHLKPSMFMTMILMEWLPAEKKLMWVGGGHEHLIHVKTLKGEVEVLKAGGLAVGMLADNSKFVKLSEIQLEENDFLVLYSDGIIEAKNVAGEIYTLNRLSEFLKSQAGADVSTETLFEKIAVDVGRFMEGQKQLDDMTLIVMKHSLKNEAEDHSTEWKG
jgi:sigma-B regulation protein RsbU (phosphoserine phosphatase)